MSPLPPDRSHIATEQRNPRSMNLHALDVASLVALINDEDHSVPSAVAAAAPAITGFISAIEPGFLRGGRLIYVGAGTSGRLGVLDASECPPTFQVDPSRVVGIIAGGDSSLRRSSEGREDEPNGAAADFTALKLTPDDAVLGIAAGGTTPYVLGALALAKQLEPRCTTGMFACADIPRPAHADHLIIVRTGPELLTGSTRMKAGTATKLVLNTITTSLMVRSGRVYENLMVDMRATNDKLRDRAARIVATLTCLDRAAALALIDACDGEAKTAIVAHRLALAPPEARRRLDAHAGRLDRALNG